MRITFLAMCECMGPRYVAVMRSSSFAFVILLFHYCEVVESRNCEKKTFIARLHSVTNAKVAHIKSSGEFSGDL